MVTEYIFLAVVFMLLTLNFQSTFQTIYKNITKKAHPIILSQLFFLYDAFKTLRKYEKLIKVLFIKNY
jgi:hypothetical protein